MKKPTHAERQAPKALSHDSILGSLSPAVASERGAVDGRPAPPSEPVPAGRTSPNQGTSLYAHREMGDRDRSGFLYRWAAMKARTDSPGVEELKAQGWTIEHVDHRYKTHLMRKELPDAFPPARGPRDRGDVDSLHAARGLVLSARSSETHLAAVGIAALLTALVLLACAFLVLAAWHRVEQAARTDEIQVAPGQR